MFFFLLIILVSIFELLNPKRFHTLLLGVSILLSESKNKQEIMQYFYKREWWNTINVFRVLWTCN